MPVTYPYPANTVLIRTNPHRGGPTVLNISNDHLFHVSTISAYKKKISLSDGTQFVAHKVNAHRLIKLRCTKTVNWQS